LDALGGWKILAIRSDTPDEIVEWVKEQVNEVLGSDDYSEYLENNGYGAFEGLMTEEELTELVEKAYEIYGDSMKNAGLM
jgi:tripartite-type tricarboxylate transporter receptor subunit TctC